MEKFLPIEIILDIFSRLPAETVLQCRQVCKTWRTLLHHPHFADMHLRQLQLLDNIGLLYLHREYGGNEKQLYYGEYDENDEQSYKTLKKINRFHFNGDHDVVGSCNGLVCLYGYNKYEDLEDSAYICNPITKEYITLPGYNFDVIRERYVIIGLNYGFGYLPSTNEYKVVRIIFSRGCNQYPSSKWVGFVQVYTLGGGTGWRNKGEITYSLSWYSVLANGALHWLEYEHMKILAFDLADEEFRVLQSPPCFGPGRNNIFQLRVLGGWLCFVHEKCMRFVDIWLLKKTSSTTYVMKEQECQPWTWHRESRLAQKGLVDVYDPFAFTKSGEVLLWYRHSILSRYNMKTKTLRKLDMEKRFHEAIPHMNSFVSLKGLGEEDAKTIGSPEGFLVEEMCQPIKHGPQKALQSLLTYSW